MFKLLNIISIITPVLSTTYNVLNNGAVGDGITDDTVAIVNVINMLSYGDTVYFPSSTYLISDQGGYTCFGIASKGYITFNGDGDTSIIKIKDNSPCHLFNLNNVYEITFSNFKIDGNVANQPIINTHAFRGDGVIKCTWDNIEVHNTNWYGIGLQHGTLAYNTIKNSKFYNTKGDGIDSKNKNNNNAYNIIDNIEVHNAGLGGTNLAAIDLRGPWDVSNVKIYDVSGSNTGVRFRQGETTDLHGLGAHGSTLDTFEIYGDGLSPISYGIYNAAREVHVSNGLIAWTGIGVKGEVIGTGLADNNIFDTISIVNVINYGVWLSSSNNQYINGYTKSVAESLRVQGNNNLYLGGKLIPTGSGSYAIRFLPGSDSNTVQGAVVSGIVQDLGTNNQII